MNKKEQSPTSTWLMSPCYQPSCDVVTLFTVLQGHRKEQATSGHLDLPSEMVAASADHSSTGFPTGVQVTWRVVVMGQGVRRAVQRLEKGGRCFGSRGGCILACKICASMYALPCFPASHLPAKERSGGLCNQDFSKARPVSIPCHHSLQCSLFQCGWMFRQGIGLDWSYPPLQPPGATPGF